MRYLTATFAVLVALVAATPAHALSGFNRTLTSSCQSGHIRVHNQHTATDWTTPQLCTEPVWSPEKQTYWYIYRPWTDFKGIDRYSEHTYPQCGYHEIQTVDDSDAPDTWTFVVAYLCG